MVNRVLFVAWDYIVWASLLVLTAWLVKKIKQTEDSNQKDMPNKVSVTQGNTNRSCRGVQQLETLGDDDQVILDDSNLSLVDFDYGLNYSQVNGDLERVETILCDFGDLVASPRKALFSPLPILPDIKNRDHLRRRAMDTTHKTKGSSIKVLGNSQLLNFRQSPQREVNSGRKSSEQSISSVLYEQYMVKQGSSTRKRRDIASKDKFLKQQAPFDGLHHFTNTNSPVRHLQSEPSLQNRSLSPSVKIVVPHGGINFQKKPLPSIPRKSIAEEIQASAIRKSRSKRKYEKSDDESQSCKEQETKRRKRDDSMTKTLQIETRKRKHVSPSVNDDVSFTVKTIQMSSSPTESNRSKYALTDQDLNQLATIDVQMDLSPNMKRKPDEEKSMSQKRSRLMSEDVDQTGKESETQLSSSLTQPFSRQQMRYESLKNSHVQKLKPPMTVSSPKSFPSKLTPGCGERRKVFPMFMSPVSDFDTIKASQDEFGEEGVTAEYYDECVKQALERVNDMLADEESDITISDKNATDTKRDFECGTGITGILPSVPVSVIAQSTHVVTASVHLSTSIAKTAQVNEAETTTPGLKPISATAESLGAKFGVEVSSASFNCIPMKVPFVASTTTTSSLSKSTPVTSLETGKGSSPLFNLISTANSQSVFVPSSTAGITVNSSTSSLPLAAATMPVAPMVTSVKPQSQGQNPASVMSTNSSFTFGSATISSSAANKASTFAFPSTPSLSGAQTTSSVTFSTNTTTKSNPFTGLSGSFSFGSSLTAPTPAVPSNIFNTTSVAPVLTSQPLFGQSVFGTSTAQTGSAVGFAPSATSSIGLSSTQSQSMFSPLNTMSCFSAMSNPSVVSTTSKTTPLLATPVNSSSGSGFGKSQFKFQQQQSSGFDFSAAVNTGPNLNFNATQGMQSFGTPGFAFGGTPPGQNAFNFVPRPSGERRPVQRAKRRQKK